MVEEGLKLLGQGSNPVEVKKGIDKGVKLVVDELKKLALDITEEKQIKAVATISGNNDEEIGNLIATALEKVGRDGVVAIEESKSGETSLEVVEGMQFERGYKSPYFVTDNNTMSAIIDDAIVTAREEIKSLREQIKLSTDPTTKAWLCQAFFVYSN